MAFNYDEYLRTDKMPTLWCWGCGDGVILKSVIRAIEKIGWNMDDVCVVSGIGCSGRFSSYINCNTVHTTHGRTLPYATGIKLANPDKKVIVVGGDGDGLAIGMLKPSIKLSFWYEFLLRATSKSLKIFVIPKNGYYHLVEREGSIMDQYKYMDGKERSWWVKLASKEYYFDKERKESYNYIPTKELTNVDGLK